MKKTLTAIVVLCLLASAYAVNNGISGPGRIKNVFIDSIAKFLSIFKLGIVGENNAGILDSRICSNFQYNCNSKNIFNYGDTGYLYFEIETWTCVNPPCEEGCFFRIARPHFTPNNPSSLTDPSFIWDDIDCDAEAYSSWWYAYPINMAGDIQVGSNTLYIDVYNCCKVQCLYDAWHTKIKYDFTVTGDGTTTVTTTLGTTTLPPFCDYDGICESNLGETSQNCTDCSNWMPIISMVILVMLVCIMTGLGIYAFRKKKK